MRQRLVPQLQLDQLPADQQVTAHQRDVAIEADARIARAAVGEIGLPALRGILRRALGFRGRCGSVFVSLVDVLRHGAAGDRGASKRGGADADPQLARQLRHFVSLGSDPFLERVQTPFHPKGVRPLSHTVSIYRLSDVKGV